MLTLRHCQKCNGTEFNNSGNCLPCQKARGRKYYLKNKDKVKKAANVWKQENPLKVKSGAKIYRERESEKMRLLQQAWVKNNPEKIKERTKRFYQKHRERLIIKSREFAKNNPDKVKSMRDSYRAKPEYRFINIKHVAARRSRINGSSGKLSNGLFERLINLQKNKCAACGVCLSSVKIHLDHVMPLALGGDNSDNNTQLLCQPCNQSKHAKHPIQFMQQRGYLL